jgi:phage terminase large subunit
MGIDYGTTNPTAAVIIAVTPNQWPQLRVQQEYYYDAAVKGRSKTDQEIVADLKQFIGWKNMSAIYIDPAAASLKIALRQAELPVIDAKNDVLLGIKICSKFISNLNLVIHRDCRTLLEHIQSYAWDAKAADRGEDKPVKKNDHILDALRYACATAFPQAEFSHPDENLTVEQLKRKIYNQDDMNPEFYGQGAGGYR